MMINCSVLALLLSYGRVQCFVFNSVKDFNKNGFDIVDLFFFWPPKLNTLGRRFSNQTMANGVLLVLIMLQMSCN